ncbi:hypothetical protein M1506_02990 [Patescibacteria group bacterium]|nr:hypothetical protein [Patescibacteria group bacterium]
MHELNTQDIQGQELEVQNETRNRLGFFCKYFNDAIDIYIRLIYKIPTNNDLTTARGEYLSQVWYWFYMRIFTFRACFVLWERGYYLEATILSRNLIEVLVRMHYFNHHPDILKTETESLGRPETREKRGTSFKTMFDEIFPGYYHQYKWMFSHFAHGGTGSLIFKADTKSRPKVEVDMGLIFNEDRASGLLNNLSVFVLGYLRFYKKLYPEVTNSLDEGIAKELERIDKKLLDNFEGHIKLKGGENEWHKVSRQIFDL